MGHWASPNKDVGMHYVKIQSGTNVAINNCNTYFFGLQANPSNSGQVQTQGTFKFTITGTKGVLDNFFVLEFFNLNFLLNNKILNVGGETTKDIGSILSVKVAYIMHPCVPIISCWIYSSSWMFKTLEITSTSPVVKLCPATNLINTGSTATFNVC